MCERLKVKYKLGLQSRTSAEEDALGNAVGNVIWEQVIKIRNNLKIFGMQIFRKGERYDLMDII